MISSGKKAYGTALRAGPQPSETAASFSTLESFVRRALQDAGAPVGKVLGSWIHVSPTLPPCREYGNKGRKKQV